MNNKATKVFFIRKNLEHLCFFFLGTKLAPDFLKLRAHLFKIFNKRMSIFNFFFIKRFLAFFLFFFRNIKKEKLIFLADKKLHYKYEYIQHYNYIFDREGFCKKYAFYKHYLRNHMEVFNEHQDTYFFFFTKNKTLLNKLNVMPCCKNIILFSDNNMSFSNFFFNVPMIVSYEFSIYFYFIILKLAS